MTNFDITIRMKDLFPEWNKDADIPMYSFSRPSTMVWNAIAEVFHESGWAMKQIEEWLQSKNARLALDGELGETLLQAARNYARTIIRVDA